MRIMTLEHIRDAKQTLQRTRARTLLTALGIAIGVASIVCILAISDGVRHLMATEVDEYDGKLIVIRPGTSVRDDNSYLNPINQQSFSASTLTDVDVEAIKSTSNVAAEAPLMVLNANIKTTKHQANNIVVLSTTPDFIKTAKMQMKFGQFLGEETNDMAVVIGSDLSIRLFDTDNSVGQVFTMRNQQFTVVGVVKSNANPVNYNSVDYGNTVFVSYNQGKILHKGNTQIQQINVLADSKDSVEKVKEELHHKILNQHLGEEDFAILSGSDINQPSGQMFIALAAVMTAIAAISLVVGGVGIMNIMLVGVAERTREIGIRKAVGASRSTIIGQFMIESLMLSLLGGVSGYVLGYILAFVISTQLYFTPVFSWVTALVAALMSIGVGVVFGTYPAVKAARKNTIESLRQYH